MAGDVLGQKDSWAGAGAKNAKSSLLLSLLAGEVEQSLRVPALGSGPFMAVCPRPGNVPSLSLS